jgi:hypothetical protein
MENKHVYSKDDFSFENILKLWNETANLPVEREYKIFTGRGGMDLIEKAFRKEGILAPNISSFVIEQDFPAEPETFF